MDPKNAARDYLLAAEKYIKDSLFDEARREVQKAQEIDPSNIYTFAFLERIEFFRQQKAKETGDTSEVTPSNGLPDDEPSADDITEEEEPVRDDSPGDESVEPDELHQKDEIEDQGTESEEIESEGTESEGTEDEGSENDISPTDAVENDDELDIQVPADRYPVAENNERVEQEDDHEYREETVENKTQEDEIIDKEKLEAKKYEFDLNDLHGDTPVENDTPADNKSDDQDGRNQNPDTPEPDITQQDVTKRADKIDELEKRVHLLSKIVEESGSQSNLSIIAEKFEQVEDQLKSFQETLQARQEQFEAEHTDAKKIHELEVQLHSLSKRINSLQDTGKTGKGDDTAAEFEAKLTALEKKLSELQQSAPIQNTKESEKHANGKVAEIERRLNDLSVSIQAELAGSKDFDRIESLLDNLQSKVEMIASSFTTDAELNKRHDEIYKKIDALEQRLLTFEQTVRGDVGKDTGDTTALEKELSSLRARLDEIDNAVQPDQGGGQGSPDTNKKLEVLSRRLDALQESIRSSEGIENTTKELRSQLFEIENKLQNQSELKQHLLTNYADLEQRLQELTASVKSKHTTREEIAGYDSVLQELRKKIEEISGSSIREHELHQTQSEILSLYTDLEHRFNELIKNQDVQREELGNRIESRQDTIDKQVAFLQTELNALKDNLGETRESRIDKGEIDSRFDRVKSTIKKLSQEFENEKGSQKKVSEVSGAIDAIYQQIEEILDKLHFEKELRTKQSELDGKVSDIAQKVDSISNRTDTARRKKDANTELEQKMLSFQQQFENEQRNYHAKLNDLTGLIENLKNIIESDQQDRKESNKRQIEIGMNHFRSAVEKSWEHGVPSEGQTAELKNLTELFSIPEPIEKQIIREVKLQMYGRAVKKAIAEKKVSRKEALSLDKLRKQYDVSLDEYMEYEFKFLDDLVSTQFQGTILLISADETARNSLSEQLKSVGFAVVNSSSPEAALDKLEVINPHVIICDAEFPGTKYNGRTMLDVVRRNAKFNFIPFIIIAEQDDFDQLRSTLTKPNEQTAKKPVEFYKLLNTINEQLKKLRDHLSSRTL